MAMSAAAGVAGTYLKTWNVTATADSDTGDVTIPHGFGAAPVDVQTQPLLLAGTLGGWSLKSIDATNIVVNKGATTTGSGNASASLRVTARLAHSLVS